MCLPFCHKWKETNYRDCLRKDDTVYASIYTLTCEKCGDIKFKKIEAPEY
jgi:hypothetical protein